MRVLGGVVDIAYGTVTGGEKPMYRIQWDNASEVPEHLSALEPAVNNPAS